MGRIHSKQKCVWTSWGCVFMGTCMQVCATGHHHVMQHTTCCICDETLVGQTRTGCSSAQVQEWVITGVVYLGLDLLWGQLIYRDTLRQGWAEQMWHTDTVVILSVMFHNTHSIFADIIQAEIFEPNLSNSIPNLSHIFARFCTLPTIPTFSRTFGPHSARYPLTLFPITSFNNSCSYCI